jgi:hypothetical protein
MLNSVLWAQNISVATKEKANLFIYHRTRNSTAVYFRQIKRNPQTGTTSVKKKGIADGLHSLSVREHEAHGHLTRLHLPVCFCISAPQPDKGTN